MEKINLAFICPDIGIDFGRSKIIFYMISYLRKYYPNSPIILITNKNNEIHNLDLGNVRIEYIPIEIKGRNIKKIIFSVAKLCKIISSNRISIIHSHHRYSDLIMYLSSFFVNVRTISTVHSFVYGFNLLSYKADRIICVSDAIKKHLKLNFNKSKNVKVIHNGIKYDELPKISRAPKESNGLKIICIGRIDYEKGQDLLLKSLEYLWAKNFNIYLTLVGDYSKNEVNTKWQLKEKFQQEYNLLLNRNSEKIKKISSNSTPWKEIINADLVVIPSRIEPFGLIALEAGGASKCVLASNTGGLEEIITDKENGLLFESENINDLIAKIEYLYYNETLRAKYGEKLQIAVEKKFSLDNMMSRYILAYKELGVG